MIRAIHLYGLAAELYDRQLWGPARKMYEAADELTTIEANDLEQEWKPIVADTEMPEVDSG